MSETMTPEAIGAEQIHMETTTTVERLKGITFTVIDCDGGTIYLEGSDGAVYAIESTYEDPLMCWKLPAGSD